MAAYIMKLNNGVPIANTTTTESLEENTPTTINGNVITSLENGNVLTLTITPEQAITTGTASNNTLIIKKLN